MNVLLIGFEASQTPQLSESLNTLMGTDNAFLQKIKAQPSWARLLSNVYLVTTNLSATEMRDTLANTPPVTRFIVYNVTNSLWAANGMPPDVAQWLQNNWKQS